MKMKFNVENVQEFQSLLDQASKKTDELIEVMKKINGFKFDVAVDKDIKKADSEETTDSGLLISLNEASDKAAKLTQLTKWARESNDLAEKQELNRLISKYLGKPFPEEKDAKETANIVKEKLTEFINDLFGKEYVTDLSEF